MVLVLKCLAHRIGEDDEDVRLLAAKAGLGSAEEVLNLVDRFFVEAVLDAG